MFWSGGHKYNLLCRCMLPTTMAFGPGHMYAVIHIRARVLWGYEELFTHEHNSMSYTHYNKAGQVIIRGSFFSWQLW